MYTLDSETDSGETDMGVSNSDVATVGLLGAVGGNYGYGYGGRGFGVDNHYLAEQNKEISRDLLHGFCESEKSTTAGFNFQNLNEANRNGQTRELIIEQNQSVKDVIGQHSRFIEASVLSNERMAQAGITNLADRIAAVELRAERRADRVDDKLCAIDKDQAVAAALAAERNATTQAKLDSIIARNEYDDAFARQLAKFQAVNGCQPQVSPCGQ